MMTGHNGLSERELLEKQKLFRGLNEIKTAKSEMGSIKGSLNDVYRGLNDIGMGKKYIEYAQGLVEKDNAEVIKDLEMRLYIARLMGHAVSRQMSIFEVDPAPATERIHNEGFTAGSMRKANLNPYNGHHENGPAWQNGFNEGAAFVNASLNEEINDIPGALGDAPDAGEVTGDDDLTDDDVMVAPDRDDAEE